MLSETDAKSLTKHQASFISRLICTFFEEPDVMLLTYKAGADPNARNSDGDTAMNRAESSDMATMVTLLRNQSCVFSR